MCSDNRLGKFDLMHNMLQGTTLNHFKKIRIILNILKFGVKLIFILNIKIKRIIKSFIY